MEQQQEQHTLTIENRKGITATQITAVVGFSPTRLTLSCRDGKIVVSGEDMKIINFSKSTGAFSAVGEINSVVYTKSASGVKKLFK